MPSEGDGGRVGGRARAVDCPYPLTSACRDVGRDLTHRDRHGRARGAAGACRAAPGVRVDVERCIGRKGSRREKNEQAD